MDIVFENDDFIVVNKESAIIVEENLFENSLEGELKKYFRAKGKKDFVGVVHRLDRVTSGCIVFAKKKSILKELNSQIESGKFSKSYLLLVEGRFENRKGILKDYLFKDLKNKKALVVDHNYKGAKLAHLKYEVLEHSKSKSLIKVKLITGRFHQIRAQFSNIGYPIVGDEKYGSKIAYKKNSICLHSHELSFEIGGERLRFEAEVFWNKVLGARS